MSPPEIWGPPIWTLFHVLAERINENAYPFIYNSLFNYILRILIQIILINVSLLLMEKF